MVPIFASSLVILPFHVCAAIIECDVEAPATLGATVTSASEPIASSGETISDATIFLENPKVHHSCRFDAARRCSLRSPATDVRVTGNICQSATVSEVDDEELLQRFLQGDRDSFRALVQRYQPVLLQIARYYVNSTASAEDVAQDTWIAVLKGAERFEGRASFKTWLFRIVANRARSTGTREKRQVPVDTTDPVAGDRFNTQGMWKEPPVVFADLLADTESNYAVAAAIHAAIADLPEIQRSVVTLRDVEGLSTSEVASLLELSEANTRVVLHRARAHIREVVERVAEGGRQ
jgi:RNA polymerase sigma-70 factor (ECF subfamily)